MLDLRRLEALVALHRAGSVSAAAEDLGCGQPTVSHHLRRLEEETASVLLQRSGRGIRLTPDGERLAQRGVEILGLLARAEEELAAATSLRSGRVRVAAFPSGAATLVPAAIAALRTTHPGLTLDLVEAEPPEADQLLRSGAVDLALTFAYPDLEPPRPSPISSAPVLDDPLHLVTAAGTATAAPVDLRDWADAPWITGCERCRSELLALCAGAGFAPRITFASDDYVAVQALVATGMGVSVLPGLALAAHRHPGVATRELPAVRRVQLSSYGAPPRPAAVDAVAEALATATATVSD